MDEGAFGENLIIQGIDLRHLPVGTRLACGEVLLEVTQIGKQCHNGCEIFRLMGDCIMPREGIFAKVLRGGMISEGDEITVEKRPLRAAILTASDSGYAGEREDVSGPTIQKILEENKDYIGFKAIEVNNQVAKVSIVGAGMVNNAGVACKMFEALSSAGVNINMISTSEIKVSVLVDEREADRAVQAIHDRFFNEFGSAN